MRAFARPVVSALVLGAVVLASAPASAQAPERAVDADAEDAGRARALDFTEVRVVGELVGPSIAWSDLRTTKRPRNLIKLRSNFRPELSRSASKLAP